MSTSVIEPRQGALGSKRSPYEMTGQRLIDNGYSAIPVMPGFKVPGTYSMKEWRHMSEWQRYCSRLPTEIETEIWNRWPDAGVCVPLNHKLKVIDIDTDDPELMAAMLTVLPDSEVKKRGQKGFSAFYRGSQAIVSQPFSIGRSRIVDLLAHGRQTVLPPTIHPDTGQPYHWLGSETLETVDINSLPDLPDNVAELLAAALTPFGYKPDEQHHALVAGEGETYWRKVNDTALKNLSAWVPYLRIPGLKKHGAGYRAIAHWRGVKNANLSIHPQGIKDWGNNESHSPIDLVMKSNGVDLHSATEFLAELMQIKWGLCDDGFDIDKFIQRNMKSKAAAS